MELTLQVLVTLATLMLLGLGTMSMFAPRRMTANFALEPVGTPGLSTIRSVMGGLFLASVALLVKPQTRPADATPWRHGWVIGDPNCRFNARSPLLRCAVWPEGPCENCSHRELR